MGNINNLTIKILLCWEFRLCWVQASLVVQMVKNLPAMQETQVQSLHQDNPLEKGMATHSSILAWAGSSTTVNPGSGLTCRNWVDLQALNCPRTESSKLFSCCSHSLVTQSLLMFLNTFHILMTPPSYISNLDLSPGLRFMHLMAYLIFPLGYFKSQLLIASLKVLSSRSLSHLS